MKFLGDLPWKLVTDEGTESEQELDAQAFAADESGFKCEMQNDFAEGLSGAVKCHPAPIAIGCSDMHAPKFCLTHYFLMNDGIGESATNGIYKIVPLNK